MLKAYFYLVAGPEEPLGEEEYWLVAHPRVGDTATRSVGHASGDGRKDVPALSKLEGREDSRIATLQSYAHALGTSRSIRTSDRMHWATEGWAWTDVALDGSISEDDLLALVDDSYQITYEALYDFQKVRLSVLTRNLKPAESFSELLSTYGLSRRREEIEGLSRRAVLLKTGRAVESKIGVGQTKIGGRPDLPDGVDWPQFTDGKPLAFLAQINLTEVASAAKLSGLPRSGLLSFFSVFGWQVAGDLDPQLPAGQYSHDWTTVLYHPGDPAALQRRRTPANVNSFKAARVEVVPITCFPSHTKEPDVAKLNWKRDVKDKYDDFVSAYNGACGHQLGNPARHLLLGYADYEQEFVKEVADEKLQLLFQLASDENAGTCWGDGGFIYFWIRPKDLARGNFAHLLTDYQCG